MHRSSHAFGAALRLLRIRRRLKQWEVAEKAGMTKAMLSGYETSKVTPTLQSLTTLFEALETDFFGFQDALDAVDRTDRSLLEVGSPSPSEIAATEGDGREPRARTKEDGSQLLEALTLRLNSIEGRLEQIATDIGLLARRVAGEAPERAAPQDLDQQ